MSRTVAPADRIDFGILLGLAYARFVDELHDALGAEGFDDLGRSYGYVFRALDGAELNASDLAARLRITNQGAVKLIDEMAARGYVERHPHPSDGRIKVLALSARGQAALAAARRFHATYEERLAADLGPARARALRRDLERLGAADDLPDGLVARLRPG
jgi:DNA-binding MarR family transcriptional regulator